MEEYCAIFSVILVLLQVIMSEGKCFLLEAEGKESTFESPGWPDGYMNNLHLCWLIQSTSEDEKIELRVKESAIQPRSYQNEWTDYVQVIDGDCDSKSVIRQWSGDDVPDVIQSTGGSLCVKFVSDDTIRNKGFVIAYSNTGDEGFSLSTMITIILVIIGVSTVTIVAVVIYFVCRRSKARQASNQGQRTTLPDDPLSDDSFPPSYSVAVRSQDVNNRTNVHSISGALAASGGRDNTDSAHDTNQDKILFDEYFGPEVPEPPSYTVAMRTPDDTPSLHRSPPSWTIGSTGN